MSLLFTMLPFYLLGNLHCLGMCGPLVMMIGHHRYRYLYFLGRTLSFSLAGLFAGALGEVLQVTLREFNILAFTSFFFGGVILGVGLLNLTGWNFSAFNFPGISRLMHKLSSISRSLSLLMLRDQPWPAFLFGLFTISLPCGQTLVVYSACALYGDPLAGLLNGMAFAVLTSPSLVAAMHAHSIFRKAKLHYNFLLGLCSLFVGTLAICRGLAELDVIPHLTLNPDASPDYHLVVF